MKKSARLSPQVQERAVRMVVEAQRTKELGRENRDLRRANEILKLGSAPFAQAELDRRLK